MAGIYHSISDAPESLRIEAETLTLKVSYGVPSTGQATVSWDVPMPARGCSSGDAGTYCGIVVVLSNEPIKPENFPTDGKYYHDDPTADKDKHVGDKIGDSLVIGSYWERDAKSSDTAMTTSFVFNDIDTSTPYYIAGFMMDCGLRYHTEGIRAYSDELCHHHLDDSGVQAFQNVGLGNELQGVLPTDGTGLIPGKKYSFDIIYDPDFPTGKEFQTYTIMVDGMDSGTYQDLLDEINKELKMIGNPAKLPYPPHTGHLYWNDETESLYEFNGTSYDLITNIYVQDTDPALIDDGSYWYNPEEGKLWVWVPYTSPPGSPATGGWQEVPFMIGIGDPTNLACDQYWFNGEYAYIWNGSQWIQLPTIIQDECPTEGHTPSCGTYWYDTDNEILYEWNEQTNSWEETTAIYWATPPNDPQDGDYWMDNSDLTLYSWGASPSAWVDVTESSGVLIQETEPAGKENGLLWYKISTEVLSIWNEGDQVWDEVLCLSWPTDPTDTSVNSLWWNSDDEYLYRWDDLNSGWQAVETFIESDVDPRTEATIAPDSVWFDPESGKSYRWDGETWVEIEPIYWETDPTTPSDGDVYYNKTDEIWYIYSTEQSPGQWVEFDPTISDTDPSMIPNGYYWMNTSNDVLSIRNGVSWVSVEYDTEPVRQELYKEWYNINDGVLYMWNGEKWVVSDGIITAHFADFIQDGCKYGGGFQFVTTKKGTGTIVFIPVAEHSSAAAANCVLSGFADFQATPVAPGGSKCSCSYYSYSGGSCGYPARIIHEEDFLWSNLNPPGGVLEPQEGQDSPHNKPSYDVLGVGTDGTPDERRELADSIRRQLGYPSVTVELTHYQIDTAIQGALESYRKRTSASLKRGYFFLDIKPRQQRYMMTNRRIGYDRIVQVMDTHRFTSAFLTQAHAAGAYGQSILQHLYNMGSYDLLSYDLVSQYINQLEISFASRLQFGWNEDKRTLDFYQSFTRPERVLLDVMVERTEQEIFKDRFAKSWIERYALSESLMVLSHIRGKFGTLPGAGGGVQLNSDQCQAISDSYRQELIAQIDEFIVEKPEEVGMASTFVFG